jgi:uncharacterized protein YfeS
VECVHPAARALMRESWLLSCADDAAPLGIDTGADTLSAFREWRPTHTTVDPVVFLRQLLRAWEVPDRDWNLLDPVVLERQLTSKEFAILTRDDTAIATAFAQLVVEGAVSRRVAQRALVALKRQGEAVVIRFRGWRDPHERQRQLRVMQSVVEQAQRVG